MQLGKFWDNTTQNRSRKILDMFWHCRTKHVFKTMSLQCSPGSMHPPPFSCSAWLTRCDTY